MERMVISSRSRHSLACGAVPCKALRKGFTIIECLISILLLAITMVGSMAFYFYSTGHLAGATHKRIAAELANAKIEELKSDYNNLTNTTQNITISSTPNINASGIPGNETVTVYNDPAGYKNVSVTVNWNEPSRADAEQNLTLTTSIAPR